MEQIEIQISEAVRKACPDLRLGCIMADVVVTNENLDFWKQAEEIFGTISNILKDTAISSLPVISDTRKGYKSLGKDPARYRPSAEALLRRVLSGKGLYRVNNVVDCLNLISAETGLSIGGYDTAKINGTILLDKGKAEPYEAIGRGELNIENLPVFHDQSGPFGSPTSDSVRTSITLETRQVLWIMFDFGGNTNLNSASHSAYNRLSRFAEAINYHNWIVN